MTDPEPRPIRPEFIDAPTSAPPSGGWPLAVGETLLVFFVFFLHGASLPPDVNEVHYLGKARHYWDPTWCPGDFFLETADAHQAFYWSFGWLTRPELELSLAQVAWIGRLATWALMAIAWRRLSWAVAPRPLLAVLAAVLFLAGVQRAHMAGEWIAGGVEAKGFAYAAMLFGLGSLAKNAWRSALVLFGVSAALHVLVGGWSLVAAAIAWLLVGRDRPRAMSLLPAAVVALAIAAPSVWFAVSLDAGVGDETLREANRIYVFERLGHHLTLEHMQPRFIVRFVLLSAVFFALRFASGHQRTGTSVAAFAAGSLAIAVVGAILSLVGYFKPEAAAPLLRFYWFRLADIAVPLGVALLLCLRIHSLLQTAPRRGGWWFGAALLLCLLHLGGLFYDRRPAGEFWQAAPADAKLRLVLADGRQIVADDDWQAICYFFVNHPSISPATKVLTPRASHTFKWYAGLPEVGTWKDIPQDARSIVAWMERMTTIHANRDPRFPDRRWTRSLTELGEDVLVRTKQGEDEVVRAKELVRVARKYGASYVITEANPPLALPRPYANDSYAIYAIPAQRPQ